LRRLRRGLVSKPAAILLYSLECVEGTYSEDYPLKHRGEQSQAHMAIIRSRKALVSSRTQLVNHVRGGVKFFGDRLPKCPARSFHIKAPEHIPEALWPALGPSWSRSAR